MPLRIRSSGSSPRWRGRRLSPHCHRRLARLIPALAGTTLQLRPGRSLTQAHPRAGGDDSRRHPCTVAYRGSSPRWRGRPVQGLTGFVNLGLIPALAGTTSPVTSRTASSRAHPRAGGDDGSTPPQALVASGLIPALAGTTRQEIAGEPSTQAHPRAGGDDSEAPAEGKSTPGSSPRWRGRPAGLIADIDGGGLIPALAGTTRRRRRCRRRRPAHPRAGGDDPATSAAPWPGCGSSPRWRGRLVWGEVHEPLKGLIPALAGTTMTGSATRRCPSAHPRAGGDDWASAWKHSASAGSSPRWRGRLRVDPIDIHREGLIPALAGTTTTPPRSTTGTGAHPRAGGDDRPDPLEVAKGTGSSPRWRGRPEGHVILHGVGGLIPALAGTTCGGRGGKHWTRAHPRAGGDDTLYFPHARWV